VCGSLGGFPGFVLSYDSTRRQPPVIHYRAAITDQWSIVLSPALSGDSQSAAHQVELGYRVGVVMMLNNRWRETIPHGSRSTPETKSAYDCSAPKCDL
jgi:hypothetical protein